MAVYSPVDIKIIDKLSFPYSVCNYVYYSNTNGKKLGTLYSTDENTFNKLQKILKGDEVIQVKKGDKVYILPGHPLSHIRIKEYLKNIGANTTKTLSSATVIAGCEDLYEEVGDYDSQAKPVSLLINAAEIYEVVLNDINADPSSLKYTIKQVHDNYSEQERLYEEFNEGVPIIISNRTHVQIGFNQNIDQVKDKYFITPDAMNTIYYILSKGLKVLTQKTIAENANSGLKLEDEETYLSIYQMLDSVDSKNKQLGIDVLIHCDLTGDTTYNMWRLSRKFKNAVDRADNSKGISYFKNISDWNELRYLNDEEFIAYAEKNDKLTSKIVEDLLPNIFYNVKGKSPINENPEDEYDEHQFFEMINNGNMSYTVQLKEKWKLILKKEIDELTTI